MPQHHKVVDSNVETYTVEALMKMQAEHEASGRHVSAPDKSVVASLLANSVSTGGDVVVSIKQQGGITAHTVVQQAPEPELRVSVEYEHRPSDEGLYQSRYVLSVIAPYPVGNLTLEAHAASILNMSVCPLRAGVFITGHSGTRKGYRFTNIPGALGSYQLDVTTAKRERIEIVYDLG